MSVTFRRANAADKDFVIKAITEAEKSGSDTISYCAVFSITEDELKVILGKILDEEMGGQELYLPGFIIAEVDGVPAATISGWIEGEEGMASSMIKSNLFMYHTDREVLMKAVPQMKLVNAVNIDREQGALQIEYVYSAEGYRGRGLAAQLVDEHIRRNREEGKQVEKVQVMLMGSNAPAIRAYEKAGFITVKEKKLDDPAITKLLSCDTKILMERILN